MLYTASTPNGHKTSIFLEELKAAYGLEYGHQKINFATLEQKEPWFLKINPNGRIPALVDHSRQNFPVFETAAILLYLAQHYDTDHKFSFDPVTQADFYSEALQWIFFAHGGVGPMQGQSNHFSRYAPEKLPYAISRYVNETKRLYSVLDDRLTGREYLVGPGAGIYSIADVNVFPWVRIHNYSGVENLDEFPNLKGWVERISQRPQVKLGLDVPNPGAHVRSKEDQDAYAASASKWILEGQEADKKV